MQVIGGNSLAQECYRASTSAALSGSAGLNDLEGCANAIAHGNLKRRDLVATYVNRGVINTALENYKDAARDYNRAISLDDSTAEAFVNRGNLWFMSNRYLEAISDYDKSLELGFAQPHVALLNRGMVREIIGQHDQAKADYEAALSEREGWKVAQQKLARVSKKIAERERKKEAELP